MNQLMNIFVWILVVYQWSIIICIILRWFPEFQNNSFARLLSNIVDPFLGIFRRFIPPLGGMDWSAFVALMALNLAIRGLS